MTPSERFPVSIVPVGFTGKVIVQATAETTDCDDWYVILSGPWVTVDVEDENI